MWRQLCFLCVSFYYWLFKGSFWERSDFLNVFSKIHYGYVENRVVLIGRSPTSPFTKPRRGIWLKNFPAYKKNKVKEKKASSQNKHGFGKNLILCTLNLNHNVRGVCSFIVWEFLGQLHEGLVDNVIYKHFLGASQEASSTFVAKTHSRYKIFRVG